MTRRDWRVILGIVAGWENGKMDTEKGFDDQPSGTRAFLVALTLTCEAHGASLFFGDASADLWMGGESRGRLADAENDAGQRFVIRGDAPKMVRADHAAALAEALRAVMTFWAGTSPPGNGDDEMPADVFDAAHAALSAHDASLTP